MISEAPNQFPETNSIRIAPKDQFFTFRLHYKPEKFGEIPIQHWWISIPEVYQGDQSLNFAQAYWDQCLKKGTASQPLVQESYLLSRILPVVRSIGSRRIFADARLRPKQKPFQKPGRIAAMPLEEILSQSGDVRITEIEFRERTAQVLGPLELSQEQKDYYHAFCEQWFGPVRDLLLTNQDQAVKVFTEFWQKQMRSVGRRAKNNLEKTIFDILSYESRAAMHRCYSAVWVECLIPYLQMRYGLSQESRSFLEFWHFEPAKESISSQSPYFHLFHGHVFGLHPAGAEFIRTEKGRSLIGDWLKAETVDFSEKNKDIGFYSRAVSLANRRMEQGKKNTELFERLLYGLLQAVFFYEGQRTDYAENRQKSPFIAGEQLDQLTNQAQLKSFKKKRLEE